MASTWFGLMIENPTINAAVTSSERGGFLFPRRDLDDLGIRGKDQQFQLDGAMWYGAIKFGPFEFVLLRLFHIFYYAGVIYWEGHHWADWFDNPDGANVASLLSHGQRVLVQIPTSQKGGDVLWTGLNTGAPIPSRGHATHGLIRESPPFKDLILGHKKYVKEEKTRLHAKSGSGMGDHYGFNVALGGKDRRNPFSAANDDKKHTYKPIAADGKNGHVYINYMPPSENAVGGMLVGCENAEFGRGGNPHTKAGHSIFGFGQDISACGGKKWKDWKCGPRKERDGFICDLTDRGENLDWLFSKPFFKADWLDQPTQQVERLRPVGQIKFGVQLPAPPHADAV